MHTTSTYPATYSSRVIPMAAIILVALAVHGPLLLMQLPAQSYDTNFHIFFAAHYAHDWFNPWNEKWFTGFNQATYPPLQHQWMALLSHIVGLNLSYMLVQMIAILLLPIGMFRYARLWVNDRAASYAALGSVLLGSLGFLVYQSGQLSTTTAAPLYLNALPYFYEWMRAARVRSLIKGLLLILAAAAAHHVTLLFGSVLFALPIVWLAVQERENERDAPEPASVAGVLSRAAIFAAISAVGVAIVLLPYWIALYKYPITQIPIPHASRFNFIHSPEWGMNFWVVPWGALIIALPFIFWRGLTERRLRPLFFGFWLTFIFGLGGTTPIPKLLLGRAFDIITFERFNFWAGLMALPIVALIAVELIDRYRLRAAIPLALAAVFTCALGIAWTNYHPINAEPFKVDQVISFLNRDGHDKFRYLTLGFGNQMSKVGTYANAQSVDGEYNSARQLPEMTQYGSAQLTNSKHYGTAGMESLRAILKHANQYGLKYIFVRDQFYEPLLAFAGWRKTEVYDNGNVTLWSKEDVPPAHKMDFGQQPPAWHGILWGTLPILSSILALLAVLLLPEQRRVLAEPIHMPVGRGNDVMLQEAK